MRVFTILSLCLVLGGCAVGEEKSKPRRLLRFWNRRSPPPPERGFKVEEGVKTTTLWKTQPLDHQGSTNTTFQMRYITNEQFFKSDNSPILLMLGGEWTIGSAGVIGGHMFEIGRDIGALLIYTEHRFYGESRPFNDTKTDNLKFLTVDQALSDVAELVKELKQQDKYAKSKVVVFGGSYAGNMATWIRLKHPDVIDAAMSSSGPVLAKVDFYEYLENVNDAILIEGGQKCLDTIREGVVKAQDMLLTKNGTIEASKLFGLCEPVDTSNPLDVQTFFGIISDAFSGLVQYAQHGEIANVCSSLVNDTRGTPVERLGEYVRSQALLGCFSSSYKEFTKSYQNTSYKSDFSTRLWLYQTCTEFGYYQTTTSRNQPFGENIPLSYFVDHMCPDLYGKSFNVDLVKAGVKRTNQVFEGLTPKTTKVISVHGTIDPWHRLGIVKDLSDSFLAILINGTSHCLDLQSSYPIDPPELTAARKTVRDTVLKWIAE